MMVMFILYSLNRYVVNQIRIDDKEREPNKFESDVAVSRCCFENTCITFQSLFQFAVGTVNIDFLCSVGYARPFARQYEVCTAY